jgi:triphosphoribosyl-dephospho-CoA synthase
MTAMLSTATPLDALAIADLAVAALHQEADLTPKPGLVDGRGAGAHDDMTLDMLHDSAEALHGAFAECAGAARTLDPGTELRALVGVIGRVGEQLMLTVTGGVNTHRGALWALGLLSAGAARGGGIAEITGFAGRLASIPDPALVGGRSTSHGANARRRFGARGAVGEAQAGFPHVTRYALPTLRQARACGADEDTARLDALLSLIAHLDDTCVLHRGDRRGLRAVQAGAAAVLRAGGSQTPIGRTRFEALDLLCVNRRLSPGGSGDLLSATLFLDALDERSVPTCKP